MQRWVLLGVISTFGFLNGVVNELSALLSTMVALMGMTLENYVYLNQVISYLGPIVALPTAWFVDHYGIRGSLFTCVLLALIRNGTRALLFLPHLAEWHQLRLCYWLAAGIAQQLIVSIYYCLPLKVAEHWFPDKLERSFAWCFMIVLPGLGATLVTFVEPHYISSVGSVWPLAYMNLLSLMLTCLVIIGGLFIVTEPTPVHYSSDTPTNGGLSERQLQVAQADKQPVKQGLKFLFLNKFVMLHLITVNVFNSIDNVIKGLMQDILGASGFSRIFCGHLLAGLNGCSCLIMLGSSFLAKDRTGEKGNTLRCKLLILIQWMAFNIYASSLILRLPGEQQLQAALLVGSAVAYTACRAWATPSLNNLLAHLVAGSSSAATLQGGATIIDFFVSNFFTFTFVGLRQVSSAEGGDGGGQQQASTNYLYSIVFLLAMVALTSLAYLTCFSGRKQPLPVIVVASGGQQQEWTRPVEVVVSTKQTTTKVDVQQQPTAVATAATSKEQQQQANVSID